MIGYTRKVGLRKPEWDDGEYPDVTIDEMVAGLRASWATAIEQLRESSRGLMQIIEQTFRATGGIDCGAADAAPGDPDHVDTPEPNPTIRETARDIWDAIIGARPCCHSTGPNHHPACQDNRTGTEQT